MTPAYCLEPTRWNRDVQRSVISLAAPQAVASRLDLTGSAAAVELIDRLADDADTPQAGARGAT
jgi:hypothetical protein